MSKNSSVHFYPIYLGFNANVAAGRLCFEFGRRITHHDKKTQYTTRSLLIKTSPPPSSPPPPPSSPPPAANSNISVASQVQPGACQGVRGLDRGGVVQQFLIKFHQLLLWQVIGAKLEMEVKDQVDFGTVLKDGAVLCQSVSTSTTTTSLPFPLKHPVVVDCASFTNSRLINAISPGSVKKINTMKAPFKQRENIEMYLKACAAYGLKEQDLFQVPLIAACQTKHCPQNNFISR